MGRSDDARRGDSPRTGPTPRDRAGIVVANPRPYRDRARDIFTRSAEGRRYERGVNLRPAWRFTDTHLGTYFPNRYCHYPYYSHTYFGVDVVVSPFHFYFGTVPMYIHRRSVFYRPPRVVYIEVPVYVGGTYYAYRDDTYYLDQDAWWRDDRALDRDVRGAVQKLEDAFRYSDIGRLADLTDAQAEIAVFSKGSYQYTLSSNDYLDMTRDFMLTADTVRFDVFRVSRRSHDAYSLAAKHVFRGRDNVTRTVYLSFVLERYGRYWTITQVDTAPDRL